MASFQTTLRNNDYTAPFFSLEAQKYGGQDFPDGLVITILNDDYTDSGSNIQLTGTRTPHMPFKIKSKMRIKKEYYAGKNEPIVQVLGESEDDLEITGTLTDRRYYDNQKIYGTDAQKNISTGYMNTLEELKRSGKPVLLTMKDRFTNTPDSLYRFDYTRYAILIETEFDVFRVTEIDYRLQFSLMTQYKPFSNFFTQPPQDKNLMNNADSLAIAVSTMEYIPSLYPDADTSVLGEITSAIQSFKNVIATVTKALESLDALAQDISQQVSKFLGIFDSALAALSKLKYDVTNTTNTIKNIPDKAKKLRSAALVATTSGLIMKPDNSIQNPNPNTSSFFSSTSNQQNAAVQNPPIISVDQIIRQMRQQFINSVKYQQVKNYVVAEGDTLASIAYRFYQDQSRWTQILLYNRLKSIKLVEGMKLEIPTL